ncbi:MAG TPA: HNH endonuclease [Phyllobacterium sp.]|nr:HNH endonuclease [Phyllobacterium sp.]
MAKVYDKRWQSLRAWYLRHHPYCVVCGALATDVDHKVTVRVAPYRKYDQSNLQSFCHKHHSLVTQAFDNASIRGACDEDGLPLDPEHPWNQKDNQAAIDTANKVRARPDPGVAARIKQQHLRRTGQRRLR